MARVVVEWEQVYGNMYEYRIMYSITSNSMNTTTLANTHVASLAIYMYMYMYTHL